MLKENIEALREFNVDKWHQAGYTGEDVTSLVLDTNHGLLPHMKAYAELYDPNGWTKKTAPNPGHNTYVTQNIQEFAPGGRSIMTPWSHDQETIVKWVRENHERIDIVNVSMTSSPHTDSYEVFREYDIPILASSGNHYARHRMGVDFPAREDFVIAIGAYNWEDNGPNTNDVVGYSNGGEDLEVVAPTNIWVLNGIGEPYQFSGTSSASPSAVGMIKLWLGWRKKCGLPKATIKDVTDFVRACALDIRVPGFDYDSGWGKFVLPAIPPVIKKPEPKPEPIVIKPAPKPVPKEEPKVEPKNKSSFTDVEDTDVDLKHIERLYKLGIMTGYKDKTYRPDNQVTRRYLAKVICKLLDHVEGK